MALRLRGATSGYIELKAPASAGDNTLTLPTNNGSANQLLKTDGSGNLSWTDDNSGVSLSGSTNNTIATVTGANALIGEANLTFDGTQLVVQGGSGTQHLFKHSAGWGGITSAGSAGGSGAGFSLANNYSGTLETKWSIYLDGGTDALRFTANTPDQTGDERLRITSTGALLIGTTSPTYGSGDMQHEIKKNNNRAYTAPLMTSHSHLLLNNSDTTDKAFTGLGFRAGSGDGSIGYVYRNSANNADFVINTDGNANGSERFRIFNNGSVLIGALANEAAGGGTSTGSARLVIDCEGMDIYDGVGDASNYGLVFANDYNTNKANGIGFFNDGGTTCGGYIVHQDKGGSNIGDLVFGTSQTADTPVERMRIDSFGRVGINTSTHPDTSSGLSITNGSSTSDHCILDIRCDDNETARVYFSETSNSGYGGIKYTFTSDSNHMGFFTNGNAANKEKVRIPKDTWGLLVTDLDASGNTGGYQTEGVSLRCSGDSTFVRTDSPPVTMTRKGNAGKVLDFYSGTNYAGGVYVDGQNSADYRSTSDYRLKDNVNTMSDGISKIKQLNPIYFTNKQIEGVTDTTTVYTGFLAHEVKSVIPTLVDGEKDAFIDHQGKGYQSLSYGRFSPTLVAALKEAIAKIETLETKVAALESA